MRSDGCLDALLKLYPYLDGELCGPESESVRKHFDLCPPCAPALPYLRSFRNALHRAALDQPGAPLGLKTRIVQSLSLAK